MKNGNESTESQVVQTKNGLYRIAKKYSILKTNCEVPGHI